MNKLSFLKKYFTIFSGFILFCLYFWNRFIRQRSSKTLPLNLDLIYLIILISICLLFTYLIYSLIFPRKNNVILENFAEIIYAPLIEFDIYIKNLAFIKFYYQKTLIFIFKKIEKMVVNSNTFFIIFWAIPRLILLTALFVDIFIFHKFHYKYMFILFGLLLFFNRYIMYSLKYYKKQIIKEYENDIKYVLMDYVPNVHPSEFEDDDDEPIPTMALPFDIYIEFQTKSIVYNNDKKNVLYISESTLLREYFWLTYIGHAELDIFNKKIPENYANIFGNVVPDNYNQAKIFVQEKIDKHIKNIEQSAIKVSLVIEHYKKNNNENVNIKIFKIFIYLNYLICWSYVLFISLQIYYPSLTDVFIFWNSILSFQDGSNPFSGSLIESFHTNYQEEKYYYSNQLIIWTFINNIKLFIDENYCIKTIMHLVKLSIMYTILYKLIFSKKDKYE